MPQRFAIESVNEVQPLDFEGGAFASGKLNVSSFENKQEMTMAKPSPAISGPGGMQ